MNKSPPNGDARNVVGLCLSLCKTVNGRKQTGNEFSCLTIPSPPQFFHEQAILTAEHWRSSLAPTAAAVTLHNQ